ncbi:MAG: phosphoglycerate kinase [Bacilli bacterium]|nr:phosphoglycerate kinase [Bacilli bacterium]
MKYIDEVELSNKKVIVRCDFNVPIENHKISDNSRIVKSLKTIEYLLKQNCSLILMSHLGRIKTREDKAKNSLKIVADELSSLLNKEVKFINNPVGMDALMACKQLSPGEIILLENARYCDYPEKLESNNDMNLSKYWSSFADAFVVDAFGSLHRAHASVAGISRYLPTYFGLLIKEEMEGLVPVTTNIVHPFGVFMGGAKIDDKLKYIKDLLPKCDYLLIGGGIANSFLYACGYDVQDSICTTDELTLEELRNLVKEYKEKIIMPIDFVIDDSKILDLGVKSIDKYTKYFQKCKTIFINGTCGKFEEKRYAKGTVSLFDAIKSIDAYKVAGGGDTLNVINEYKLNGSFSFLSSGGGASLEYISSGHLEAIDFINNK